MILGVECLVKTFLINGHKRPVTNFAVENSIEGQGENEQSWHALYKKLQNLQISSLSKHAELL